MKLVIFLAFYFCLPAHLTLADDAVDPDTMAFITAISMNRGLYYNYQPIVSLNSSNFNSIARGKNHSWFIEFYSSWCGHCHRFRTTFMRLALDISGWRDVVKVGAVDCSNELNTPLCRDFEVLSYPTLRFFPPNFTDNFFGTPTNTKVIEDMRVNIVDGLLNHTNLEQLQYYTGMSDSVWSGVSSDVNSIVLVVDCLPKLGAQLALDYWSLKSIKILIIPCRGSPFLTEMNLRSGSTDLYVLKRGKSPEMISSSVNSREQALDVLYKHFAAEGIQTVKPANLSSVKNLVVDIATAIELARTGSEWRDKFNKKQLTGQVFQVDIEGALRHSLNVEMSGHKTISGSAFEAAKNYLAVLEKYFPFGENGKHFLRCVLQAFQDVNNRTILGVEVSNAVSSCERSHDPVYLDEHSGWIGCRGTLPNFRGYPCSMWTMFHTLTVQASKKGATDGREVLGAMVGYIGNFFGCTDCAQHFIKMAETMTNDVKTPEDGILWLWKSHNKVNKRLQGDATQDPKYPKVQFPPPTVCPKCQLPNGLFDETQVLTFLNHMYTNISYIVLKDVVIPSTSPPPQEESPDRVQPSHQLKHNMIVDEVRHRDTNTVTNKILWDFTLFDVSLCFLLYLVSIGLVVFVCIKFLKNRRSYRKKTHYGEKF